MKTTMQIVGTRYTQASRRDQEKDFADALKHAEPLMYLHGLGYDCSEARVDKFAPKDEDG